MNRAYLVASAAIVLTLPQLAQATPCAICDGTTACSSATEVCLGGLPETATGRCTAPCPNPGAPFGGCPTNYTCVPLTSGPSVCAPRSDDCTALNNYVPVGPGQACTTQSCTDNALCVGGVCSVPCAGLGQPGCPNGQFCGFIGLPDSPFFICGPGVGEGATCNSGDLCMVGLCLNDGTTTQCYRNCGTGAASSACQAGQTCDPIQLSSGETISLCLPPISGPGPTPDAGVGQPDAAPTFPDANTGFPDARPAAPDAAPPGEDAATMNPGDDARVTNPGEDGGVSTANDDASVSSPPDTGGSSRSGGGGGVVRRSSGCTCLAPSAPMSPGVWLALLAPLALIGRRVSGRRRARS